MSETYKEQHPLLSDDLSDEEYHVRGKTPPFQQRYRHTSGRARAHALGAAAIINHWPDHLSSLLMYWWVGLGMIAVIVFVIYNTIVTIAALPPTHVRPIKFQNPYASQLRTYENSTAQTVYMHVFVTRYDEFNINDHIPYVETVARKYEDFKYNFIVVLYDVTQDMAHDLSIDEQNNKMALNSLLDDNENKVEKVDKFTVQYISFTKYMDNSPLKKYWRLVPRQFLGFLVRCVAIWDQGGVALNPSLLNSDTQNSVYLKKIKDVFDDIQPTKTPVSTKRNKSKKSKKKFNNIRDIINDLENTDESDNFPDSLDEAENKNNIIITNHDLNTEYKTNAKISPKQQKFLKQLLSYQRYAIYNKTNSNMHDSTNFIETPESHNNSQVENSITKKQSLLPKLLDSLFNGRTKNATFQMNNMKNITGLYSKQFIATTQIKENPVILNKKIISNVTSTNIEDVSDLSAQIKSTTKDTTDSNKITKKLIIDLKGNLIATPTSCHAFIGTVFSNILHHTDKETVTDFIIAELSLFCKGFLSSCNGVDIVLL